MCSTSKKIGEEKGSGDGPGVMPPSTEGKGKRKTTGAGSALTNTARQVERGRKGRREEKNRIQLGKRKRPARLLNVAQKKGGGGRKKGGPSVPGPVGCPTKKKKKELGVYHADRI